MRNLIPYLSILAAAIGGSVALYIRRRNRTEKGLDDFGVFIRSKIAELSEGSTSTFYNKTKPDMRIAIQKVWHFLSAERRSSLDRLWKEYDDIDANELDDSGPKVATGNYIAKLQERKFTHPIELLRYYLDEFYKFSA